MTNETKNIPELRFPEFEGEWDEKELGDISNFSKGKSISKGDLSKKGASCILYGELYTKYGEMIEEIYSKTDLDTKNLKKGNENEILIPSSGETAIDIATASTINTKQEVYVGGDINIMTPKPNYDGCFISLSINGVNKLSLARYAQGKSVVHLYNNDIKKLKMSLPKNLEEQQKIGDFFSKLDRQIELEEKKLALLEEQKKGYMQQIFSQELRFKDENGNNYPEWETLKVKDIAETFRGLTYKPEDIRTEGVRVLRSSNIIKDKIHFYEDDIFVDERVVKIPLVDEDDILITAANGSPKLVGKHAIIEKLKDKSVAGGFMYILRSNYSKFMQIWMSTTEYRRIISRVQGGNGSIGNLSRNDLENGNITLPCNEEKSKIGNFFKKIDELIERQYTKIELLKKRKQGLLQKMFV